MGWAIAYIEKLKNDETVQFRPRGNSMKGKIESGQLCTVKPITEIENLQKGDIVLCKVNGREYLHLIKAIQGKMISNRQQSRADKRLDWCEFDFR